MLLNHLDTNKNDPFDATAKPITTEIMIASTPHANVEDFNCRPRIDLSPPRHRDREPIVHQRRVPFHFSPFTLPFLPPQFSQLPIRAYFPSSSIPLSIPFHSSSTSFSKKKKKNFLASRNKIINPILKIRPKRSFLLRVQEEGRKSWRIMRANGSSRGRGGGEYPSCRIAIEKPVSRRGTTLR